MKREFLQNLNLEKETIDLIINEYNTITNQRIADITTEKNLVTSRLDEANRQIEDFKKSDVEGIKKTAEEYKIKFETSEAKSKEKLEEMKFTHALDKALDSAKVRDTKLIEMLLDKNSLKLDENGVIKGLDTQIESLKKTREYLFNTQKPVITAPNTGNSTENSDPFIQGLNK